MSKNIFKEFLSFNSRRAVVINLSTILVGLRLVPAERIGSFCIFKNFIFPFIFNGCPTKGLFVGCNCPACGLTRATAYFLRGEIKTAMSFNKLVLILVPFIFGLIIYNLYWIIKKK